LMLGGALDSTFIGSNTYYINFGEPLNKSHK